jgi:phosphoglycerate dehydrogenase-like enzyme
MTGSFQPSTVSRPCCTANRQTAARFDTAIDRPFWDENKFEVIHVPPEAPIPDGVEGDVLLMTFGNGAIYALVERGVKWVHFVGTGIDSFDLARLAHGRLFTNSRGVVEVPISEWVLAVLLHHEKQLDQVLAREPPAAWPVRTSLGTLHGKRLALLGLGAIGAAVARRALPLALRCERCVARRSRARCSASSWSTLEPMHRLRRPG